MSGGCHKFHWLLKSLYPNAKGWYDSEHVITEIGGRFYDIDGERTNDGFLPFSDFGDEYFDSIYRQMQLRCHPPGNE